MQRPLLSPVDAAEAKPEQPALLGTFGTLLQITDGLGPCCADADHDRRSRKQHVDHLLALLFTPSGAQAHAVGTGHNIRRALKRLFIDMASSIRQTESQRLRLLYFGGMVAANRHFSAWVKPRRGTICKTKSGQRIAFQCRTYF